MKEKTPVWSQEEEDEGRGHSPPENIPVFTSPCSRCKGPGGVQNQRDPSLDSFSLEIRSITKSSCGSSPSFAGELNFSDIFSVIKLKMMKILLKQMT